MCKLAQNPNPVFFQSMAPISWSHQTLPFTPGLNWLQCSLLLWDRNCVSIVMSWMLPLRCHARCKAALLQICHSAAFQYFRFWWPLAKEHQRTWTCQWNRTECTTEPRAKHRGGQKRKCLDGGVHQGGCSSLGLGALESFYGQGAGLRIPVPTPKQERSN